MSTYSIPSFVMVVVTFYVGCYHLFLYFRRRFSHPEDLSFSVCCLTMSLYGLFTVGMYNADSLKTGVLFQRGQVAFLTLIGSVFLWFVVDYLNIRKRWVRNIFSPFFLVSSIVVALNHTHFTFHLDQPLIKDISLPFGKMIRYYEVRPGPFIEVLSFMGMMVFVYAFVMALREYRHGDRRKAMSLIGAILIFSLGLVNDVSVHFGLYEFPYIIEYGYMGIVLLMAGSLSNEVVESAIRKEALEESEKKYRELVDNSLVGIFIVQDPVISFCNQRFAEIFEWPSADSVLNEEWSRFIDPEQTEFILGEMNMTRLSRTEHKQLEFKGRKKNGETIDIQMFFGYIMINNAPVIQGTLIDMTDRKRAEAQLVHTTNELKLYTFELEQFVNVTTHHLQEPLRSISSYVQLIARRYRDALDQKAKEYIDFAVEGVDRMYQLINDFLVYTRIGKPWQMRRKVALNPILERVIHHLRPSLDEKKCEITVDPLPWVVGEETKLEILFRNLIVNSIFYRSHEALRIHVYSENSDGGFRIAVRDNGIGIDPEYHLLIFGMFQKLNKMVPGTGTGIGLTVCKKIVEQHQGQLWVESEEGQGSTFYFTLADSEMKSSEVIPNH